MLLRRSPRQLPLFCAAVSIGLPLLGLAWGAVLLLALPRGLGHLMLGSMWRPTYPLVLPAIFFVMGLCTDTGAVLGLHVLGAARRSLRAAALSSTLLVACALVGAVTGGALGTMRFVAVASWLAALVFWWQLRQALLDSGTVPVPGWLWPGRQQNATAGPPRLTQELPPHQENGPRERSP